MWHSVSYLGLVLMREMLTASLEGKVELGGCEIPTHYRVNADLIKGHIHSPFPPREGVYKGVLASATVHLMNQFGISTMYMYMYV